MVTDPGNTRRDVWQALEKWAPNLQRWQRYVLAKAVTGGTLSADEVLDAYRLMQADHGLAAEPDPAIQLPKTMTGRPAATPKPLRLVAIRDIDNVNALPSGLALPLGPGLTVIYGRNGTGKSGLFRIFSSACFSRSKPKQLLPNVYGQNKTATPSATVVIDDGSGSEKPIALSACAGSELGRVAVFDDSIAQVHISSDNEFSFKPAGFDVFAEMVRVNSLVVARLEADIKSRSMELPQLFVGQEPTAVSIAVSQITSDTDPELLRKIGTFGELEMAEFEEIARKLGELRATSVEHLKAQAEQAKSDVETVLRKLTTALTALAPEACERWQQDLSQYAELTRLAATDGVDGLKNDALKSIGGPAWQTFVAAANALAMEQGDQYPEVGQPCLLCHRPLDASGHAVLHATWRFIRGEAKRKADAALATMRAAAQSLAKIDLVGLEPDSRARSHLERINPDLAKDVIRFLDKLRSTRDGIVATLTAGSGAIETPPAATASDTLRAVIEKLGAEIEQYKTVSTDEAIRALAKRYSELRHQEVLSKNLDAVVRYLLELKWKALAAEVRRTALTTRAITDKETELSEELISEDYEKQLAAEFKALDCALPMAPAMRGRDGRTVRKLALPVKQKPTDVLSEGELKAVALADFLAEVVLNPSSAAIVFDDPVTSLDNDRKDRIAVRLVAEAARRQVIVFTHDMEFLVQLCDACEQVGAAPTTHWVDVDGNRVPGALVLNDGPQTSKLYRTSEHAKKKLQEALATVGTPRLLALREGFGAVRICLESLILNVLLNDLVSPYRRHVKMNNITKITWKQDVANEVLQMFNEISSYIDAHSRPDGTTGSAPTTDDLKQFVERYDALRARAKSAQ